MRYLSPNSLPTGPLPNPPDRRSLALLRKKLLAELELSAAGTLIIKDQTYTKNDILEYFETLQNEAVLHHHQLIADDKVLLDFLETGEIPMDATFVRSEAYTDPDFRQWLSPYFYAPFIKYIHGCLENTDEESLKTLFHNPILLTEYDRERAWDRVGKMLQENIEELESYHKDAKNKIRDVADISVLITDSLTRMILMFPQNRFRHIRDDYAFAAMQVSIVVFNKSRGHRDLIAAWMANAKELAVSEEIRSQVESKTRAMEKKKNAMYIRAAVVIGFVLLKLITFNTTSSTDVVPKNAVFIYNHDTVKNAHQLDSLMHGQTMQ